MKRIIAFAFVMVMVLALASCREHVGVADETTASGVETTGVANSETNAVTDVETFPGTDAVTDKETEPETEIETETTEPETTIASSAMNVDKAVAVAKAYLGEKDPDVGYTYSYQFVEMTDEGNYKIRVSWYLPEDERYSTCGYLIVTPEGAVSKFDW